MLILIIKKGSTKMIIFTDVPEREVPYSETALAMYDGGWRSTDREQMLDEFVNGKYVDKNERWTEEEVDIICDLLEKIENRE